MTHNNIHDRVWACTSGVVNYRSQKFLDQLHEFYIATWSGVLSVNERPGLEASLLWDKQKNYKALFRSNIYGYWTRLRVSEHVEYSVNMAHSISQRLSSAHQWKLCCVTVLVLCTYQCVARDMRGNLTLIWPDVHVGPIYTGWFDLALHIALRSKHFFYNLFWCCLIEAIKEPVLTGWNWVIWRQSAPPAWVDLGYGLELMLAPPSRGSGVSHWYLHYYRVAL